jgi:pyruvate formate lyase activating enzyme
MAELSNSGIVFDIQRASLHDGPGIRTTVFLKGCPLRCVWCHNPEANRLKPQLFFYQERCTSCGNCVLACQHATHRVANSVHFIDYAKCVAAGDCVKACNQQALKIVGSEMTVSEVMQVVLADRSFYERSGGGLTLSGGEPMMQFSFTLDLLQVAKREGIETCLETSGFTPQERFEEIMPYVDLFLFDYKITGRDEHRFYTGVSNELILSNLNYLCQQQKPVLLRCPIIPQINDTQTHFKAIAEMSEKYPKLAGIEILPYHDMGNCKRTCIGVPTTLDGLKSIPPETTHQWLSAIHGFGCDKARIG